MSLLRVNEPSRAEIGCLSIDVFESLQEPSVFAIHSEWADEASFEARSIRIYQSPWHIRLDSPYPIG